MHPDCLHYQAVLDNRADARMRNARDESMPIHIAARYGARIDRLIASDCPALGIASDYLSECPLMISLIRYGKLDTLAALIAFDPGTLLAQVIAI